MIVGVVKETFPGETRVALVPSALPPLLKAKIEVVVEAGAGAESGYPDSEYEEKGAKVLPTRQDVFERADAIAQVRCLGANPEHGKPDLELLRKGRIVLGCMDPLGAPEAARELASRGVVSFSMELMPRITRAQSMDVLSSMGTISGYKAVLMAAAALPRMIPMMTTAAGTITPAKVFIVGAGVAGLQAIASAKRMGAVVHAYDVRPVVKEQVESLGAKFVELPLESGGAEDKGGYAKALGEEFYKKQRELMGNVVKDSDIVITTALIPGKAAPVLVTAEMVDRMKPGSVVVDLAAERGGNVEPSRADETVLHRGVTIFGPTNLPATVPYHASQMYAKNVATFLLHLVKTGLTGSGEAAKIDLADEIARETLVTRDGEVFNARVRGALGLPPLPEPAAPAEASAPKGEK